MMRELKFRAWLNVENKMIQTKNFYGIDYYNGCIWYKKNDKSRGVNLDGVEIMQSTGLKDRNGVEIYEGDIVKVNEEDLNPLSMIKDTYHILVVEFSEEEVSFILKNKKTIGNCPGELVSAFSKNSFEVCEVIGNIFEDGDLIDG